MHNLFFPLTFIFILLLLLVCVVTVGHVCVSCVFVSFYMLRCQEDNIKINLREIERSGIEWNYLKN
jgi:hypothetical protein